MKISESNLDKKLRKPSSNKTRKKSKKPLSNASKRFPLLTSDRRPTYAGIHRHFWREACADRKLEDSTIKTYESAIDRYVLRAFDHTIAFEDLMEEDVFAAWERIAETGCAKSTLRNASSIIRILFDYAFKCGLTQLTLWGTDITVNDPDRKKAQEKDPKEAHKSAAEKKGTRLAKEVLQLRSLPLTVELRLVRILIRNAENFGELIGALIMLCTGARTSEVCGLTFKRFQKMLDGYWTLVRVDTMDPSRRELEHLGGKTENAYRYLFVPPFLARILQERKELLQKLYPNLDIDEFPICCRGKEYRKPCTQKELNRLFKLAFHLAELNEDIMKSAYHALQQNQEDAQDAEMDVTAYLCRKHFATTAQACGLNTEEICIAMGHSIASDRFHSYDAANPEFYQKISDKLYRWPLARLMDNCSDVASYTFREKGAHTFHNTLPIELHLPKGFSYHLDVQAVAANDPISIQEDDFQRADSHEGWLPETPDQTTALSPLRHLITQSQHAWNAEIDDSEPISLIPASTTSNYNWSVVLNTSAPRKEKINPYAEDDSVPAPEYAVSAIPLFAVYADGSILPQFNPQPIRNLATAGVHMVKKDQPKLCRLLVHDSQHVALVVSPTGTVFKLAKGTHIDDHAFCMQDNPAYQALLAGGILLQGDALADPSGTIVCIVNSGRVRRVSTKKLQRFSDDGRQLLALDADEYIVDACLCDSSQDVLFVTEQGQALRVEPKALAAVSTIGSAPYTGIQLEDNDAAAACIAYTQGREYMLVKRNGMIARIGKEFKLSAHGRGGKGVKFSDVAPGDKVLRVLPCSDALLLISATHSLCIQADEVHPLKTAGKGVRAISLKPDQFLLDAMSLQFYSGT